MNARGDRVHVPAGVGLRRAGGRPRELCEHNVSSPAKLGWMGGAALAARAVRTCALLFARAHTGRAHVLLKPLLRAVPVCRVPDGFGRRVFACALSGPSL